MQTAPIVTYVRVSTSGQGRSGLGIAHSDEVGHGFRAKPAACTD